MQLKETDFSYYKYRRITIVSNTDSGLFAVQYGDDSPTPEPKFEREFRDWEFRDKGDTYQLRIPKPAQRKVLRSLVVMRTSTNHYEITYADTIGCVQTSVKSMTAVHEFLTPLWSRGLDNDNE